MLERSGLVKIKYVLSLFNFVLELLFGTYFGFTSFFIKPPNSVNEVNCLYTCS